MDILESFAYHRLLLMYKGEITLEDVLEGAEPGLESATRGYGVGVWHLVEGRRIEAETIFRRILDGTTWAAFGYLAAEAEVDRNPEG